MQDIDLTPLSPASLQLTGMDQTLRRPERSKAGKHRVWYVIPRYGTAESDRWTLLAVPAPADGNPATDIENGQFPSLAAAYEARDQAELIDDGTSSEDMRWFLAGRESVPDGNDVSGEW